MNKTTIIALASLVIVINLSSIAAKAQPQYDENNYGEEYYYQEYTEAEDLGYYEYEGGAESDYYTTTTASTTTRRTTTTTTTRAPRRPPRTTTRRTTTTTSMPPKRFMSGRTSQTQDRQLETTTEQLDLSQTVEPGLELTTEALENSDEYGNKLVYLGYRKEDYYCPEGYVLDIYGYCRAIFYEEKRDWRWWTNIRNYILGVYNSGYQSSY